MTVAALKGVMATVFRIRWIITVHFLELAVRVMLLAAMFKRSGGRRNVKALPRGSAAPS